MISNKVIKFGDNIDTDQIIPAQYLRLATIEDMAPHAFEHDMNFVNNLKEGYILVGGENFGCGSSREQAPAVLLSRGVTAIVAKSFARIFFRNSINLGLPLIQCPDTDEFSNLDEISIDFDEGSIANRTTGYTCGFEPLPPFIKNILDAGGVVSLYTQRHNIR